MLGRAVRFALLFMLLTGIIYPLVVTGLAQVIFPHQAKGSLIQDSNGKTIGSALIGQRFTGPEFFHGRPSAVEYDAASTGASNLAPSDTQLIERVGADMEKWQQANDGQPALPELVTTSGSGVDPDLSPEAALAQVKRVSRATGIPETELNALIAQHTEGRTWGFLGEPRVNVLQLNLALQRRKSR